VIYWTNNSFRYFTWKSTWMLSCFTRATRKRCDAEWWPQNSVFSTDCKWQILQCELSCLSS